MVLGDRVASKWQAGAGFAGTAESRRAAFVVTPLASSRNLLANPFNCNCQLAWLGDWLRKRKIVTGNPRCQNPDFLRQIPLQDVASPDFRCEEGNAWAPLPGWWGDRAWSCPREEGSPGEGRGEEQDTHSVLRLPQPGGVSGVIIRTMVGLLFLKNGEIQTKEGHKCYLLARHSEKIIVNILV